MSRWYAYITVTDVLERGRVVYPAGSAVSFGTQARSVEDLADAGLEAVDLGEYLDGIDWTALRYDAAARALVPIDPPIDDPESDENLAAELEAVALKLRRRSSGQGARVR